MALRALQIRFRGIAAETDLRLGQLVAGWFPNVTAQGDCLQLEAADLRGQIMRSGCTQVLLAGGPHVPRSLH